MDVHVYNALKQKVPRESRDSTLLACYHVILHLNQRCNVTWPPALQIRSEEFHPYVALYDAYTHTI